jgi:hypothetical protein
MAHLMTKQAGNFYDRVLLLMGESILGWAIALSGIGV